MLTSFFSIGIVTIHKAGTVRITATTAEGYEKSEYVTMTVTNTNPYVEITGPGHRLANGKNIAVFIQFGNSLIGGFPSDILAYRTVQECVKTYGVRFLVQLYGICWPCGKQG